MLHLRRYNIVSVAIVIATSKYLKSKHLYVTCHRHNVVTVHHWYDAVILLFEIDIDQLDNT